MSGWWDKEAGRLQQMGRASEGEKAETCSADDARRAAVYSREDLILVVSYLSSLNRQISQLKTILTVLTVIVGVIGFKFITR